MTKPNLTMCSLFTGIGGFDLGAEWAGIKTILQVEIDEYCREKLKENFNCEIENDVRESNGCKANIVCAGFPCQDISRANSKGKGIKGSRSGLWSEVRRITGRNKPEYIILENSPDITKKGLEKVLFDLAQIGYDAEWQTLSNYQFGFPHIRKRIYIIAYPCSFRQQTDTGVFDDESIAKSLEKVKRRLNIFFEPSRIHSLQFWNEVFEQFHGLDDGIPKELLAKEAGAYGNSVNPFITYFLFELIKDHYQQVYK